MSAPAPADCFAESYAAARARFLAACAEVGGAELASHRHPQSGPDGAPLFLDVARFGPRDAGRVLYLASGTHGVEGFCGSGVQVFVLRDGIAGRLPAGVALVLVHAVNPHGFAWLRRVNEDNVDVNRNFLDHAAPHPESPDYDALCDAVNPERLDGAAVARLLEAVRRFEQERGAAAVYRALSGGQCRHLRGVQYGGREPVRSNRVLRAVWAARSRSAERVLNVDLHSGLGPRGVGLLLQTAAEDSVAARLGRAWWPDLIRTEPATGSDAARVSGLIGRAFRAAHAGAEAVDVVLEFGTRDMSEVMLAVQADNWREHHAERDSEASRAIAGRVRDAFFPEDDVWKEQVCRRAGEVLERALAGIVGGGARP
jgi:hypothetical protein